MAEKDSQSNSEEQKQGKFFNQEQYDMLICCSDKKDISKWNEWREKHPDEEILLENADLENAKLDYAHLEGAKLRGAHLENAKL